MTNRALLVVDMQNGFCHPVTATTSAWTLPRSRP